ncbi:MAG: flagellar basal body P-ring formation protein FlgA [Candidatus Saccharibacteria bacterium]|nr:flagellar basal body P-ring formation protein FlgA [Pseudorhodobacter sp.]
MRWLALLMFSGPAMADSLIATHTIRAQTVLTAEDFTTVDADIPGALSDPAAVIGLEAKVTIYAGRPLTANAVGAAALVERNQTVSLVYNAGGLSILTEGRALSRGGAGDVIKVMNLSSRTTVNGTVRTDGTVSVTSTDEG